MFTPTSDTEPSGHKGTPFSKHQYQAIMLLVDRGHVTRSDALNHFHHATNFHRAVNRLMDWGLVEKHEDQEPVQYVMPGQVRDNLVDMYDSITPKGLV